MSLDAFADFIGLAIYDENGAQIDTIVRVEQQADGIHAIGTTTDLLIG